MEMANRGHSSSSSAAETECYSAPSIINGFCISSALPAGRVIAGLLPRSNFTLVHMIRKSIANTGHPSRRVRPSGFHPIFGNEISVQLDDRINVF